MIERTSADINLPPHRVVVVGRLVRSSRKLGLHWRWGKQALLWSMEERRQLEWDMQEQPYSDKQEQPHWDMQERPHRGMQERHKGRRGRTEQSPDLCHSH